MKALTIHQPWAYAIVRLDKRVENRPWRPADFALSIGERFAIHAGKKNPPADAAFIRNQIGHRIPHPLPLGAIVGTARFRGAVRPFDVPFEWCPEPWIAGPWCWLIDEVVALDEPIQCRGAQGLWTVPADIAVRL